MTPQVIALHPATVSGIAIVSTTAALFGIHRYVRAFGDKTSQTLIVWCVTGLLFMPALFVRGATDDGDDEWVQWCAERASIKVSIMAEAANAPHAAP